LVVGHTHLIRLPATKKWNQVVELLGGGAELETIAAAAEAAESSLPSASRDPALVRAFWLLTQIPLAARTQDFSDSLRRLGVETGPSPGLVEVVGALTEAIDRHVGRTGGRTDLGEMAQLAAAESLSSVVGRDLPGLFGTTPDDVKLAVGRFSGKGRFADLARDFFSRLTFRCLDYYLSRELSNHVGPERRFRSIREHTEFDSALDLHCRETSRILKEYAAEWFSKKNFKKALTPDEAGRFASVAFGKIRKELRKRRDAHG
jgi:hypothetical protein